MEFLGLPKKRPFWFYLGPAFLAAVGYMDPGNWATSLEAGSRFGYSLLFVVTLSSALAVFLQALSAKLGVVTGQDLAEHLRARYPRGRHLLFPVVLLAMIATDLAEFMGVAVGLNLLFGIPLVAAAWITLLDVLLILYLDRFGYRPLEILVGGLAGAVALCYLVEVLLARPGPDLLPHLLLPDAQIRDPEALYLALGILGATVMPHNLFLHSFQVKTRLGEAPRRVYRFALVDTVIALAGAWLVNAAILIVSAQVFHGHGLVIDELEKAYHTLTPLLGPLAGLAFGVGLLASGLASSTTGTLAAQAVVEGFLGRKVERGVLRLGIRLAAMLPASLALTLGAEPSRLIVLSQVVLSFALPFVLFPLARLTEDPVLMGPFRNRPMARLLAWGAALAITGLNLWLLLGLVRG